MMNEQATNEKTIGEDSSVMMSIRSMLAIAICNAAISNHSFHDKIVRR